MAVSYNLTEADQINYCKVCETDGYATQAGEICSECQKHMCEKCFRDHLKAETCRSHVLTPQTDNEEEKTVNRKVDVCWKHGNEVIKYYCQKHGAIACGDCLVSHHEGCQMQYIKDLSAKCKEGNLFKELSKKLKELEAESTLNKRQLEDNIKVSHLLIEEAVFAVKDLRKSLNDLLDKAEEDILDQINLVLKENEASLSTLKTSIEVANQEIDKIRQSLDKVAENANHLFISLVQSKSEIAKVSSLINEIKTKNIIKTFAFIPEPKLEELILKESKIGTLKRRSGKSKKVRGKKDVKNSLIDSIDPRSGGFDVGKRVKHKVLFIPYVGTVIDVDSKGYVNVKWDFEGPESRCCAGAGGKYDVKLC